MENKKNYNKLEDTLKSVAIYTHVMLKRSYPDTPDLPETLSWEEKCNWVKAQWEMRERKIELDKLKAKRLTNLRINLN